MALLKAFQLNFFINPCLPKAKTSFECLVVKMPFGIKTHAQETLSCNNNKYLYIRLYEKYRHFLINIVCISIQNSEIFEEFIGKESLP